MRTTRLFYPGELTTGTEIQLESSASTHLIRVLRTRPGTAITLFNGQGGEYQCRTLDAEPRKTGVAIISHTPVDVESPLKITLVQGISRSDRMDLCIQKTTELGVTRIIPVICDRSNIKQDKSSRLAKKLTHWKQVAISACEQSGRCFIPKIEAVQTQDEFMQRAEKDPFRIFLEPDAKETLSSIKPDTDNNAVTVFIGPEGGLSEKEIEKFRQDSWHGVRLGPRILRTETAGPAVIASMQLLYGDFRDCK